MELTRSPWGRAAVAGMLAGVLLSLPWLAGCDPQRVAQLEEGVSTEVEVRQQFGDPVTVTAQPDGSRVFDYPRQPEGWTNYVITIGPDGKMSSLRQLLNPDNFARVQPGLDRQAVRNLLGPAGADEALRAEERGGLGLALQAGRPAVEDSSASPSAPTARCWRTAIGDDPREIAGGGK